METHILVVEDDAEIREGVAIYLKNQGYTVHGAANGAQGLELARQLPIHLAVVDVMMPVMDGITMVMKLRDEGCEFPVIMLSAKSEDIDKITGLNIGADDYVTSAGTKNFCGRRAQPLRPPCAPMSSAGWSCARTPRS